MSHSLVFSPQFLSPMPSVLLAYPLMFKPPHLVPLGFPPTCPSVRFVVSIMSSSSHVTQNSVLDPLLFFLCLLFLETFLCSQYSNYVVADDSTKCISIATEL